MNKKEKKVSLPNWKKVDRNKNLSKIVSPKDENSVENNENISKDKVVNSTLEDKQNGKVIQNENKSAPLINNKIQQTQINDKTEKKTLIDPAKELKKQIQKMHKEALTEKFGLKKPVPKLCQSCFKTIENDAYIIGKVRIYIFAENVISPFPVAVIVNDRLNGQ